MGSRLSTTVKCPCFRPAHRQETSTACVSTHTDAGDDVIRPSSTRQCEPTVVQPSFTKRKPVDVINADVQSLLHRDSENLEALWDFAKQEMGELEYDARSNPETPGYDPFCENILVPTVIVQEKRTMDDSRTLFPINSDEEKNPTSYVYRILFDKSIPLLMLGESSQLSMTIAVAFMRESFDDIYSSTYQLSKCPRNIEQIKQLIDRQRRKVRRDVSRGTTSTDLNPDDVARITLTIDATNLEVALSEYPDTPTDLIWFPFPCKVGKTAHGLLKGIIESAASVQRNKPGGGVLLIGLSTYPAYTVRYGDMGEILRYAKQLGYEHLVEDRFIKTTCCEFGYRHRWEGQDIGRRSIHDKATNSSAIHIFIMRPKLSLN